MLLLLLLLLLLLPQCDGRTGPESPEDVKTPEVQNRLKT